MNVKWIFAGIGICLVAAVESLRNGTIINTTRQIQFVSVFRRGSDFYYGAGGTSYGLGGWTDVYDKDGNLAMKATSDDISNNEDPCFGQDSMAVSCGSRVGRVSCASS